MNQLNLQLAKSPVISSPTVYIDGEVVPIIPGKNSQRDSVRYETERDYVEVVVMKHYELESKWWFLMNLLFFFVSILGIFDTWLGKRFYGVHYRARIYLNGDTNLLIKFNGFRDGQRAIEMTGDARIEEIENDYYLNKTLLKRRKAVIWTRVLIWLALLGALAFWAITHF